MPTNITPGTEKPGDGGVGYSWFAVDVVSVDVPVEPPVDPTPVDPPPVPYPTEPVWTPEHGKPLIFSSYEDRFAASFDVVKNNVDRHPASFTVVATTVARSDANFAVVVHNQDAFAGFASVSDRIARIKQEDQEILAIF